MCTDYASSAKSELMAGRVVSEKSWQANIIITKKKKKKIESSLLMKHNYNDDDDFYKEDIRVSNSKS